MLIRRLFPVFVALAALSACQEEVDETPDAACPDVPPPSQEETIFAGYDAAARAFEADNGLVVGWADWMIAHKSDFKKAYVRARTDRRIRVFVTYDRAIAYDPPWANEQEHFAALERMAELAYPGWDFSFSDADPDAEFTAILGEHGGVSYEDGPTVHLVWEGIFLHEFGHAIGLGHHYCDGTLDPCAYTPPGEFEAKCIMSRNAATWGPAEQFVLNLGRQRLEDEVNEVITDINGRYPPGWPN